MATLPMSSTAVNNSDELSQLLAQLEPNILPPEPSIWPLALGYWLIIGGLILVVVLGIIYWRTSYLARTSKKEINRIRSLSNSQQQLLAAHQLLRWLLYKKELLAVNSNNAQFALTLREKFNCQVNWLNGHYQNNQNIQLDFEELTGLTKQIIKGDKK